MDRPIRPFVACGLGLLLAASGCRATRTEVPPGRPFAKDGQQRPAIEFSSDGHPVNASSSAAFTPSTNMGGSNMAAGIGSSGIRPDGSAFGAPPGAYGPPGTAGMGPSAPSDPATSRASVAPTSLPPAGLPPLESPPATGPDLDVKPTPPTRGETPSQTVISPMDRPGSMGSPEQMPSPM